MERKSFPFELEEKGLDPEARTFKGYAAVTGILDDGGDIIDRGAFKKTLEESGHRVKVFYIHDFSKPIGRPVEYDDGTIGLREVSRGQLPKALRDKWPQATGGLFVHCYISPTTVGDEALTLMRDRVLDELSIGYKSVKEKMEDDGPDGQTARHLKELALLDVSPVPLAMNPAAVVTDVKEFKVEETEDYIRVPVPGEEGKHEGHRIRTITISAEKGIKALYCGECEKNITYLFSKDKGWTVAKAVAWVKEHSKEYSDWVAQLREILRQAGFDSIESDGQEGAELKGVVPFQDLPLADEKREWDASAARQRLASWAGGPDKESVSWAKYRRAFVWVDSAHADEYGGYKLPIADVIEGRLMAVPRGIFAVAVVLQGGRGLEGVDVAGCKAHIARYYAKMDREPPWKANSELLNAMIQRAEIQRRMIEAHLK